MIDRKVIKSIMFGAGCLLGIRSCVAKKLPTSSPLDYADEIAWHINELYKAHDMRFDAYDLGLDLNNPHVQKKLSNFFNAIYLIYFAKREEFNVILNFCTNKRLTLAECAIILAAPEGRTLLLACAECVNCAEQLFNTDDSMSQSCVNYFARLQNPQDQFNLLFKPIIELRLRQGQQGPTPQLNMSFAKLSMRKT